MNKPIPNYYTPEMWDILIFVMGNGRSCLGYWHRSEYDLRQTYTQELIDRAVRHGLIRFRGMLVKPTHRAYRWFYRVKWGDNK